MKPKECPKLARTLAQSTPHASLDMPGISPAASLARALITMFGSGPAARASLVRLGDQGAPCGAEQQRQPVRAAGRGRKIIPRATGRGQGTKHRKDNGLNARSWGASTPMKMCIQANLDDADALRHMNKNNSERAVCITHPLAPISTSFLFVFDTEWVMSTRSIRAEISCCRLV